MPAEGFADPITSNGTKFPLNTPVSKLIEHDTRAIEASVISSAPPIAETKGGVTHEIWPTPTKSNEARGLKTPDPNSGVHLIEVRRPAREGLEAALRQTEPGEKKLR